MKKILLFLFIFIPAICFADRVCLEKSTGKLIEYQSGEAPLGTLTKNAVNAGYNANDIIEKNVTKEEWETIRQTQIIKPAQDEIIKKEQERKQKEQAIKQKLNLSDKDFQDLRDSLNK